MARTGPAGLATIGLVGLLIAIWGGIIPYVGPLLGFSINCQPALEFNLIHALLYLIPGVVAIFSALVLMGLVRASGVAGRASAGTFGLVMVACGLWFALGWVVWPMLYSSPDSVTFTAHSAFSGALFVDLLGYNIGVGAVLVLLGGMAYGASRRERVL
jgi:hypothetical protein